MRQLAYKYRIYPTEEQKQVINQTMGCVRYIWNDALAKKREAFEKGEKLPMGEISKQIPGMKAKEETAWLSDAVSSSLLWALRDLNTAYDNYFRNLKNGKVKKMRKSYIANCKKRNIEVCNGKLIEMGQPRFKRRGHRQTMKFHQGYTIDFENSVINMPKCKGVKAVFHRKFEGLSKTITVEKTPSGKYFIAVMVEEHEFVAPPLPAVKEETTVGLHNGISVFVTSDEAIVVAKTNRYLENSLQRLSVLQRRFSRKEEKSNRWHRQRIQIAKLHEKIVNQRNALLHHVSVAILSNPKYQTICVEKWDKKEMMRNPIFARAIADVSWGRLIEYIKYKAAWLGKNILEIDTYAPNAMTCSSCLHINKWVELRHRTWTCENCGTQHKREPNCAKNTKQMALNSFFDSKVA